MYKAACRRRTLDLYAEKIKMRADTYVEVKAGEVKCVNKVVKLDNDDLHIIVNGRSTDELKDRPFDYVFTRERVRQAFFAIGFIPPTREMLNNPKVRHERGEKGDPYNLDALEETYILKKKEAERD